MSVEMSNLVDNLLATQVMTSCKNCKRCDIMELKMVMMATIADAAYERGQEIVIERLKKIGQTEAVYQLKNLSY